MIAIAAKAVETGMLSLVFKGKSPKESIIVEPDPMKRKNPQRAKTISWKNLIGIKGLGKIQILPHTVMGDLSPQTIPTIRMRVNKKNPMQVAISKFWLSIVRPQI